VRTCTIILQHGPRTLVTDPWFSMRMRFLPALRRPGVRLESVPPPDVVLLSHLHADHFEPRAVRSLCSDGTLVVGPVGTASRLLPGTAGRVLELGDGSTGTHAGIDLNAWRLEHTYPPPDELGYRVTMGPFSVFFAGDAAWGPQYAAISASGPVDVALLPVGGSLILGRRTVMSPGQALDAGTALGARFVVPTHPGWDWLPMPPLSFHPGTAAAAERLARRRNLSLEVVRLKPGQTACFAKNPDGETVRSR
jgi:L-ascorbate metabolism protein UlaG (beta-lactamase superfamily)